jgi:hypothetical protein
MKSTHTKNLERARAKRAAAQTNPDYPDVDMERILRNAAALSFHPNIVNEFVSYQMSQSRQPLGPRLEEMKEVLPLLLEHNKDTMPPELAAGMAAALDKPLPRLSFPTRERWAASMAELMTKSKRFSKFVAACITEGHKTLWRTSPEESQQRFKAAGAPVAAGSDAALAKAHQVLAANPAHPAWIAVTFFSFGRMIATNATAGFNAERWGDFEMTFMGLDKAFTLGTAKDFSTLMLEDLPTLIPNDVLCQRIGAGAPVALATMASLDPTEDFFKAL